MNVITPHEYFRFGQNFQKVQLVKAGEALSDIYEENREIGDFLKNNDLKVSRRVFDSSIGEVLEKFKKEKIETFSESEVNEIHTNIEVLFHTISAESLDRLMYVPKEKRYDSRKLLENVASLFAKEVFENLPEMAKFDFKEACRCILFEIPTAAAYHLLRATEEQVKNLFFQLSGTTEKIGNGTWGDYESQLNARYKINVSEALLEQLRHIRKSFRNPTQHPEMKYDIDEAQDLLNLCIDVANRVSKVK